MKRLILGGLVGLLSLGAQAQDDDSIIRITDNSSSEGNYVEQVWRYSPAAVMEHSNEPSMGISPRSASYNPDTNRPGYEQFFEDLVTNWEEDEKFDINEDVGFMPVMGSYSPRVKVKMHVKEVDNRSPGLNDALSVTPQKLGLDLGIINLETPEFNKEGYVSLIGGERSFERLECSDRNKFMPKEIQRISSCPYLDPRRTLPNPESGWYGGVQVSVPIENVPVVRDLFR